MMRKMSVNPKKYESSASLEFDGKTRDGGFVDRTTGRGGAIHLKQDSPADA